MKVTRLRLAALASFAGVSLVLLVGLTAAGGAGAAVSAVPLGTTGSFSVLAGAGITNTGPTRVSGDIGTFPTTSISGLGSLTVGGANHGGDAVAQKAKTDLVTAYNAAAGQGPTNPIAGDLAGRTLVAGIYNSASSIGLSGALTLNAQGNPNAVFVFQAGSSLTTASGSHILLTGGAQACNVFWKVGSSATLGTGSTFLGSILALTSITVTTGVTIDGRTLARNGAVTLDTDTITTSTCAAKAGRTSATGAVAATPAQKNLATKRMVAKKLAEKKAAAARQELTAHVVPPKAPRHPYGLTG
jgi:hypothetical protein